MAKAAETMPAEDFVDSAWESRSATLKGFAQIRRFVCQIATESPAGSTIVAVCAGPAGQEPVAMEPFSASRPPAPPTATARHAGGMDAGVFAGLAVPEVSVTEPGSAKSRPPLAPPTAQTSNVAQMDAGVFAGLAVPEHLAMTRESAPLTTMGGEPSLSAAMTETVRGLTSAATPPTWDSTSIWVSALRSFSATFSFQMEGEIAISVALETVADKHHRGVIATIYACSTEIAAGTHAPCVASVADSSATLVKRGNMDKTKQENSSRRATESHFNNSGSASLNLFQSSP